MPYAAGTTIVARATPPGKSAIGLIRLSGPEAWRIVYGLCPLLPKPAAARQALVCDIQLQLGDGTSLCDRCVVTFSAGPGSYSGEDMAEISLHGNPILMARVEQACIDSGAVPAEAGEFTFRAYLNSKLDLIQAEAVQELIQAGSIKALQLASSSIAGNASARVLGWQERLTGLLAGIELIHDYAADDLDATIDPLVLLTPAQVAAEAALIQAEMQQVVETARRLAPLRDGISIALCGPPNAGKSTLFNAILGQERAITDPAPGTTRDYLSESIEAGGTRLTLVDTAGYRQASEAIELAGIRRTGEWAATADIVLWIESADTGQRTVPPDLQAVNPVLVVTKCDVLEHWPAHDETEIHVSGKTGRGVSLLLERVQSRLPEISSGEMASYTARQSAGIFRCAGLLQQALDATGQQLPLDAVAQDLYASVRALDAVYREPDTQAVVNAVFSRFCVGK